MAKFIGLMRAIAVKPDGSMGAHDNHGVEQEKSEQRQAEIVENEKIEKWNH